MARLQYMSLFFISLYYENKDMEIMVDYEQ